MSQAHHHEHIQSLLARMEKARIMSRLTLVAACHRPRLPRTITHHATLTARRRAATFRAWHDICFIFLSATSTVTHMSSSLFFVVPRGDAYVFEDRCVALACSFHCGRPRNHARKQGGPLQVSPTYQWSDLSSLSIEDINRRTLKAAAEIREKQAESPIQHQH